MKTTFRIAVRALAALAASGAATQTFPSKTMHILVGFPPGDIITRLNTESARIMRGKQTRERLYSFGAEPIDNTPAEFAAYINTEIAKWAKVVKAAGIKVD